MGARFYWVSGLLVLLLLVALVVIPEPADPPDESADATVQPAEPPAETAAAATGPVGPPVTQGAADSAVEPQAGAPEPVDATADHAATLKSVDDRLASALEMLNRQQDLLQAQKTQLDSQSQLLTQQGQRIDQLVTTMDAMQGKATLAATGIDTIGQGADDSAASASQSVDVGEPSTAAADADEGAAAAPGEEAGTVATQASKDATSAEKVQEDDPTRVIMRSLPGAMRLPGTNTVMRWGGFVKSTLVKSFDPLGTTDRFIVGAIPVNNTQGVEEETSVTASQSRLSLDMREPSSAGLLRAFVEADFAGDGETFRLRHAFGQRGNVLAGKTWSGFVDRGASPEEVDFEGLNGRINVRQPQLRFQPRIGKSLELLFSLEDPNPEVTNGDGVSQTPDVVLSTRLNLREGIHTRLAVLLRQVRAQWDDDPDKVNSEFGYALQLSGRIHAPWFDARDNILFQLNAGKGYGRYVNDLNSVGNFDGVFSPDGELELIDVLAGYVSGQHWWRDSLRSNLTFGFVELDNPGFVEDDFYKRTLRASGNLIWSPTPRFNVGGELLWGMRENEDGEDGTASQFQLAAKYLF